MRLYEITIKTKLDGEHRIHIHAETLQAARDKVAEFIDLSMVDVLTLEEVLEAPCSKD
jgi:hypothetical protein